MKEKFYNNKEKIYDAEVLESSSIDENIIKKILIKAGRTIEIGRASCRERV